MSATTALGAPAERSLAARYLSCIRWSEVAVLQGPPLLGFVLGMQQPTPGLWRDLALLVFADVCLVAHVFLLNDWCGVSADLADPRKARHVFTAKGVSRNELGWLTTIALLLEVMLFGSIGRVPLFFATGIAFLSALYSLPQVDWKGKAPLGSVAHLAGGTLHFLLGYSSARSIDGRAVALAIFFALTFAAGHLNQELRDYEGDASSGVRTTAVSFGQRRAYFASVFLFTLAHGWLFVMAVGGVLPLPVAGLIVLYPLHLRWSFQALSDGLSHASICRLQARYRALYAVIGLVMVLSTFS